MVICQLWGFTFGFLPFANTVIVGSWICCEFGLSNCTALKNVNILIIFINIKSVSMYFPWISLNVSYLISNGTYGSLIALDFMLKPWNFSHFFSGHFSDFTLEYLSMAYKLITFYLIFVGTLWLMMLFPFSLLIVFIGLIVDFSFLNVLFADSINPTVLNGWHCSILLSSYIDYVCTQARLPISFYSLA